MVENKSISQHKTVLNQLDICYHETKQHIGSGDCNLWSGGVAEDGRLGTGILKSMLAQ